ncbi:MAG: DMT family transporter [Actinomycetota bacterium]|nr:DMT family transporter [Actinomycetota bacterium]MDA3028865.1 DMT family transporter [Actinomycetota bacterium]
MLVAGLLALGAAVLHASWNFIAKRSVDPFVSLWGLSIVAGAISAVVLAVGYTAGAGPASASWLSAAATGAVHIVYLSLLGRAFAEGDFSLAYPIARGGGALVAGLGGIVLLGDRPTLLTIAAFLVTLGGMTLLAWGARRRQVLMALTIAGAIGTYTTIDSHAVRETDSALYVFAVYAAIAVALSMWGVARGRVNDLASLLRTDLRIVTLAAVLSLSAYGLVLVAVTRAPVGYVAAIRETSVLIAVLLGWKVLGESHGRTRVVGAITVCAGLSSLFLVAA